MHACSCVHMFEHACRGWGTASGVITETGPLIILELTNYIRPANHCVPSACVCCPRDEMRSTYLTFYKTWILGLELCSSCLQGKCFMEQAILTTPSIVSMFLKQRRSSSMNTVVPYVPKHILRYKVFEESLQKREEKLDEVPSLCVTWTF